MRLTPAVTILCALATAGVTSLSAQVRPGQVVRWEDGVTMKRGLFREIGPGGHIVVDAPDSAVVLDPSANIVEYRNGNRSRWGSAGIGLLVGGAVGMFMGLADGDDQCSAGSWCIFDYSAGEKAAGGFVVMGTVGAIVGALAIPPSRWIRLRTAAGPPVALLVEPQRVGVTLRF